METSQNQEPRSAASGNGGNQSEAAQHLGRVIDESLFAMHFQPIVDLRSQSVFAYEALCRPQDGYFKSPVDLISAAVEASRIGELGRLQRAAALEGSTDSVLFLNLEPHEFDEPWLVRPDDPIFKHRHHVYLEITENVPLKYFDQCHSVLAELRKKGNSLVIDDFGAGFSNIKYIAELEPDIVKLDRDLVRDCKIGTSGFRLLKSITNLCHQMNAKVVAEGIETVDELDAVLTSGVDYGQGYLLARPAAEPPDIEWPQGAVRMVEGPLADQPPEPETKGEERGEEPDDDATNDREYVLQAEITKLNEFLVQSEVARLALVRKLKEYSGAIGDPSFADDSTDAKAPAQSEPTASQEARRSSIPRLAIFIPLVLALLVAGWAFWPSSDSQSEEDATAEPVAAVEPHANPVTQAPDPPNTLPAEKVASPDASVGSDPSVRAETLAEVVEDPAIPALQTADQNFSEEPSVEPSQASPPASSAAPTPEPEPAPAVIASKIASRISGWANAWSEQHVDEYLSFYSPEFKSTSGQSYRAWSATRRQRIAAPASINVAVSHLDFTFSQPDRAISSFQQTYSSPGYGDEVRKTLVWALEGGQWHILSESSEPLP